MSRHRMTEVRLCPLEHDTDEHGNPLQEEAAPGLVLCRKHRGQLARDISGLPDLYDALAFRLHPSGASIKPYTSHDAGGVETVNPMTGEEEMQAFINGRVAALRVLIVSTLASWVVLVSEERGLLAPQTAEPHALAGWLGRHIDWIAAQPFADEPAGHFRELNGQAWRMAYPNGGRHQVVCGRCLEVTVCDVTTKRERQCPGSLVIAWVEPADLYPESIDCTICGKSWEARYWSDLGDRIRAAS